MAAETSLRRRLAAELAGVQQALQQGQQNDHLTQSIRAWHQDFHAELRGGEREQQILNMYLEKMKGLMRSPEGLTPLDQRCMLSRAPIDDQAVLGQDGNTYGEKALKVYLLALRGADRFKLPYQPENPTPFTVVPHPLARHMAVWLARHGLNIQHPTVVEDVPLPTARTYRTFQYAQRMEQRREEMDRSVAAELEQFRQENVQAARAQLAPLQEQMEQGEAARQARVEGMRQEHNAFHEEHRAGMQTMQNRLDELDREAHVLDEQIQVTETATENVAKSQVQLQSAIQQALQPQPKKKTRWEKVAIATVVAVTCNVNIPF